MAQATYFDINSTYAKVDFSPMAVAFLDSIVERSSPDAFCRDQRDAAVRIAQQHGTAPYDGRFAVEYSSH